MRLSYSLNPLKLMKALCLVIGVLAFLHAIMVIAEYSFGRPGFLELHALFDMNREQNIPTLFSTFQLLLASGLLCLLADESRRSRRGDFGYWVGLALVFMFLAGDEFCEWHEYLIGPLRRMLHPQGALSFAWVIPYSALVLAFAACFARFWWRLPPRHRRLFAVAGAVYVFAGIGMEMVGSKLFTVYGWESVQFDSQTLFEESLEMFGVTLFVYALTGILQERIGTLTLTLQPHVVPASAPASAPVPAFPARGPRARSTAPLPEGRTNFTARGSARASSSRSIA